MNTVLQSRADSSAGSRQRPCSSQQIQPPPARATALDLRKVYKRKKSCVKQEEGV